MVKEKYPDLDFSDINFSDMRGHEKEGSAQNTGVKGAQGPVQEEGVQVQVAGDAAFIPQSLGIESDVINIDESSLVNVPSN